MKEKEDEKKAEGAKEVKQEKQAKKRGRPVGAKTMKRKPKVAIKEDREKIARILAFNDYALRPTQRILAKEGIEVSIQALQRYSKEFEGKFDNLPQKYLENFEKNLAERDNMIIHHAYNLKEIILKKLLEVIPEEKNPNTLVNVMNMLQNITSRIRGYDEDFSHSSTPLIEQIGSYLNKKNRKEKEQKQDEQKDNIERDIQDIPFEPV